MLKPPRDEQADAEEREELTTLRRVCFLQAVQANNRSARAKSDIDDDRADAETCLEFTRQYQAYSERIESGTWSPFGMDGDGEDSGG